MKAKDKVRKTKKHSQNITKDEGDIEAGFDTINAGSFATAKPIIVPCDTNDDPITWSTKRDEFINDVDSARQGMFLKHDNCYMFEKQEAGHLGYKPSRYVYQNGQTYDDQTMRDRLQRIENILNANIKKRNGTSKVKEYFFYCIAFLLLTSSTTLDSVVESAACGDAPEIDVNNSTAQALLSYNHCREGFLVKGVYESSIYITIILLAHIFEFTASKMNKSSNKLTVLYNHFDRVRLRFLEAHQYIKHKIYVIKKIEFVQYITLQFWDELGSVLGYTNSAKFLNSCYTKQAAMVDLNIRIGIYEFFLKLSNNLRDLEKLDKKITGYRGQELAATIVDTLVLRYRNKIEKSGIFFMQFKSIIDFQKILYIADAILDFKLFIKEGHVSKANIKRATLLHSKESEESDSLQTCSNNEQVFDRKMLVDCTKSGGFISFSQGLKQRNNYERSALSSPEISVIVDKADASQIDKNEEKTNDSNGKSSLSSSSSKSSLSEKEIKSLCSNEIIRQYIRDCASNTFDNKLITQETLNYIFSKWDDINPTMSEMKKFQSHINQVILNYKLPWNAMYGVYSFAQALLISLPILSVKDASFMKIETQWPLNFVAGITMLILQLPKNVMQKDRNLAKTNMEHLENNLQNLISDDWILLSEDDGKLNTTKSIQYMNFINTCTVYLICKKQHKSNIEKFESGDLVSLVTFIWVSLIEFYHRDDIVNFEIKEKEQVKYIVEYLHLNMQSHYGIGLNNLKNARYAWRISNIKSLEIDMVLQTVKDSIHHSTNSADLIEIGKLFRISDEYKALDKAGAEHFLRIAIKTIRDFKIENHIKEVEEDTKLEIVTQIKNYASKMPNRIRKGGLQNCSRFKRKIRKFCEEAIGQNELLQTDSEISILQI